VAVEQQVDEAPEKPVQDILSGFAPIDHDFEPKPRRERKYAWSVRSVQVVAGVVISFVALYLFILKPALDGKITGWTPSVGDCVTAAHSDADVKDVKRVDCKDSQAAEKVIGVFQSREKADFDGPDNPCLGMDDAVETIFYGKPHNGFILCLAAN
jgi:hypothetical protein